MITYANQNFLVPDEALLLLTWCWENAAKDKMPLKLYFADNIPLLLCKLLYP